MRDELTPGTNFSRLRRNSPAAQVSRDDLMIADACPHAAPPSSPRPLPKLYLGGGRSLDIRLYDSGWRRNDHSRRDFPGAQGKVFDMIENTQPARLAVSHKRIFRSVPLALTLVALTACSNESPSDQPAETAPAAVPTTPAPAVADEEAIAKESPALVVEAEGLRLFNRQSGSARAIAFGTPHDDVLSMLAFLGKPETGTNGECGAGALDYANWPSGLGLFFQDDKFAGWNLNGRSKGEVTTASGVGIGSSRTDLESAYAANISETTLGTEFAAGELFGLLDGKGKAA